MIKCCIFKKGSNYFTKREVTHSLSKLNMIKSANINNLDDIALGIVIKHKSKIIFYKKFLNFLGTCSSLLKKIIILHRMDFVFKRFEFFSYTLDNFFLFINQNSSARNVILTKNNIPSKPETQKYIKNKHFQNVYLIFKDILKY